MISHNSEKKRNLLISCQRCTKINMADTPTSIEQSQSKPRKSRSRNFSEAEKAAIYENYNVYKHILGKKHVSGSKNANTRKMQNQAWKSITDKVNAVGRALRTVDDVKGRPKSQY